MIPPTFIQDLLARVDVVEVVGRHVQLKKSGVNLSGLCPFHAEKSPSFTVSPAKQFYHCFGCGANGDVIRFLTEYSGMTFVDAVKDLAQQVGMTVPDDDVTPAERERADAQRQRRATLSDVLAKAAAAYAQQLKGSTRAKDYLKGRGLTGAVAAHFGLGYAPDGWRHLAGVFPDYDDALLEESGLVIAKEADPPAADAGASPAGPRPPAGGKRYDRFRDRIMFPIRSVQGDVIGFGGRVLDRGEPKYLNSPETPVFSKGRELYGLYEGRGAIRQHGHALVVEGYMDVVALAQSGIGNAVATLGTACTPDHLQKLFRFTDSVVFSFDGDNAGRRAAARALEASLPHATDTRTIRFLFLPPEHDPDSYVREFGGDAFAEQVRLAVPLSRQLIEVAGAEGDLATAEGRARLLAQARPMWSALPEGALKRQLLGEIADAARDDADTLLQLWAAPGAAAASGTATRGAPTLPVPAPRRLRPPARGAANLLDRAVWLLVQRSEVWSLLDGAAHDLLAAQPGPYESLFRCVERLVHELGPLAPRAMFEELTRHAHEQGDGLAVLERIGAFHAPEPQADIAAEMALVLVKLRLSAVDEELKLLFESGDGLSDHAKDRGRALMAERQRLKAP